MAATSNASDPTALSELGQWAKFYASLGMHVFPVVPNGKTPATAHGHKDATTDAGQITAWWTANPQANIGWWPGGSGHLVVDCDRHGGADGVESLEHWFAGYTDLGDVPATLAQDTGGGGRQFVFTLPSGVQVRDQVNWQPSVDVKSLTGYVVLAPSIHPSATSYTWRGGNRSFDLKAAAPVPSELLAALRSGTASSAERSESPIRGISTEDLLCGVPEGQRNDTLFRAACRLWNETGDRITVGLRIAYAATQAVPPVDENEVRTIIERACSYPRGTIPDSTPDAERPALNAAMKAQHETEVEKRLQKLRTDAEANERFEIEQRGEPEELLLLSAVDLLDRPAPTWLVDGLLPETGVFQIYGESGSGKSFGMQDLLMCIATGQPWLGGLDINVQGAAVYVAAEGMFDLPTRVKAWTAHHGGVTPDRFITIGDQETNLRLSHDIDRVIDACIALDPVAVVFDTWALHTPGAKENDATDAGVVIANLKRLSVELGSLVGTVHHTGKNPELGARGSSAMRAAWDAEFKFTGTQLINTKLKAGPLHRPIGVELQTVQLGDGQSSLVPVMRAQSSIANLSELAAKDGHRDLLIKRAITEVIRGAGPSGLSYTDLRGIAIKRLREISPDRKGISNPNFKPYFDASLAQGVVVLKGRHYHPGESA